MRTVCQTRYVQVALDNSPASVCQLAIEPHQDGETDAEPGVGRGPGRDVHVRASAGRFEVQLRLWDDNGVTEVAVSRHRDGALRGARGRDVVR